MLTLDYRLDPAAADKAKEVDMASADDVSLRYRLFPGDIVLRAGDVDFSTHWGWVQVLDFALGLAAIETSLEEEREARFEFTESNAALTFQLEGDTVCVSSSYASGLMRILVSEFREEVKRFASRVVRELCERYPRLAMNSEIRARAGS